MRRIRTATVAAVTRLAARSLAAAEDIYADAVARGLPPCQREFTRAAQRSIKRHMRSTIPAPKEETT